MREIEEFVDERHKQCCIHCGSNIERVTANRDHVPTKSLLSREIRNVGAEYDRTKRYEEGYLPQVVVCKDCNTSFSKDETYLLCVLHAVMAGSLYPDPLKFAEAAKVLRSNRDIVRELKAQPDGQLPLFQDLSPFTIYPNLDRIRRVIVKNARGHAYHELGEPVFGEPDWVLVQPLTSLSAESRRAFEEAPISAGGVWPEVGSRMTLRVLAGYDLAGGWIEVEKERYRYAVNWEGEVVIRTVIWDYLATETIWLN
ncbi:hypothetical protein [Thalassospira sp. ER-Se-21-Dark]|uniref:hypothetical protein n=1 Tax=Thalassospira sp. ER-Se-21-Dark TaxID=2585190 RepID=UPI001B301D5F|nr:hypothetical protein [Thalassospira sp. ER-Se-21-Dark]MBP3126070.1 hypothetical protein [Thalassospira sp. ER-Se-21-Dark]